METIITGLFLSYLHHLPTWLEEWENDSFRTYSDAIDISSFRIKSKFSIFISTKSNEINYIVRARKDRNVVTGKTRIFFEKVCKLSRPINISKVIEISDSRMKTSINKMLESEISQLTANRWNAFIHYLFVNDKEQHKKIIDILSNRNKKSDATNYKTININNERDAIGLSLRIAGINNYYNEISEWNTEESTTPDFLKGITSTKLREDQMIINDFKYFKDWEIINEFNNNVHVFSDGINKVSVMNANRTPIETTIGVDLFYYNHIFKNYIFVQYKRLTKSGNQYNYNIKSDSSFIKEIERMSTFESYHINDDDYKTDIIDYRISDEMFYFKFCRDEQDILTKDLSKGMYLPKSYIESYINNTKNKSISYEMVDRYLNNTMFIDMVKTGFFGSKFRDSQGISNLLNSIIASGKSLIIAVKDRDSSM